MARLAKDLERKLNLKVNIDTRGAEQKLKSFERSVDRTRERLNARSVDLDVSVSVDQNAAREAGAEARRSAEGGFGDPNVVVRADMDTRPFERAYKRVVAQLKKLTTKRYKVEVDLVYDERGFAKLQDTIVGAKEARRLKVDVEYDIDTEAARSEVARAREELRLLLAETDAAVDTSIAVSVELRGTATVLAELASIKAALDALPRDVNVGIDTRGGVAAAATAAAGAGSADLVQTLQDAGVEVGNLLQGADALRSLLSYDFSPIVKEQGVEAARALNAGVTGEVGKLAGKVKDTFKGVSDRVIAIDSKGEAEVITKAQSVAAALRAVPERISTRFTVDAEAFNDDSIRRVVDAAGEAREAAEEVVESRVLLGSLRRRAQAQAAKEAQYEQFAKAAEEQALKLAQTAAERLDDLQAQIAADEARKVADRRAANLARLRGGADAIAAEAARIADQVDNDLRTSRLEDRQLKITTRFEGYARFIAQLAEGNRALDTLEATREVGIDVDGFNAQLAEARSLLSEWDREEVTAELAIDGRALFAAITRAEQQLARLDGRVVTSEFDLDGLTQSAAELAEFSRLLAAIDESDVDVNIDVKRLRRALADLAKLELAKVAASGDVTINVDVDRGTLPRALAGVARGVGSAVALIGRGLSTAVEGFSTLSKVGSTAAEGVQQAFGQVGDQLSKTAKQAGELAGAVSSAAGPAGAVISAIVSAVAGPTLISTVIGAVTALAGPVLAAVGGLVGAAVAFLGASAVAGLAAGGLPIAAVLLGPAKDELTKLLEPLKAQLLDAFAPTTDLIVNRIAPAFADVASKLIPVVAKVSEGFITPIADSLFTLFANPALADAITRLSEPMGAGIASLIDTFAKYVPLFTDIALKIGPPITEAVDAIIDVVLTLGAVFADDIAGAFQIIADLFTNLRPVLAGFAPLLTPLVGLLAALVQALIEASAGVEAKMGPIGDVIDDIAAAIPAAIPGLIALGQLFVSLLPLVEGAIRGFPFFAAAVTSTFAVVAGAVYVVLKVFGLLSKGVTGVLDFIIAAAARFLDGLATVIEAVDGFIPGLEGIADAARNGADTLDQTRESIRGVGNDIFDAGDLAYAAANNFGNMTDTALGLGDALDPVSEAAAAAKLNIAQLDAQLATGKISVSEYGAAVVEAGGTAIPQLNSAIDDFIKKAGEGEFAASKFADTVRRELPSAADFVEDITIKSPVGQMREDRDRQREMDNLNRQAQRDAEQIGRNAEDYQRAIEDAAKLRQEAPKLYTFGARNFNAALFADSVERQEEYERQTADAERNIQDRARALDDARRQAQDSQIALEDAQYDALFGTPEDIQVKVIDIRAALDQAGRDLAASAEKARGLIQIRNLGPGFDPFADFLETLDPEQFSQAIDQLGGVGSEAFRAQAAQWETALQEGNTTVEELFDARRQTIADEAKRLERLAALYEGGLAPLANGLVGLSTEEFNAAYDGLFSQGLAAVAAQNEIAKELDAEQQASLDRAKELAKKYGVEIPESIAAGAESSSAAASERVRKAIDDTGGVGRFNQPSKPFEIADLLPDRGETDSEAAAVGGAAAGALIEGFTGVFSSERGQAVTKGISALVRDVDTEEWATAGRAAAGAFTTAFGSTLTSGGGVGAGGIFGPNGAGGSGAAGPVNAVVDKITSNVEPFAGAGRTLGGALIVGMIDGLNINAVGLNGALLLLTGSLATEAVVGAWNTSGLTLGEAVLNGIRDGMENNRVLAAAKLVSVRVRLVESSAPGFTSSGDALGAAMVLGLVEAIRARASLFVLAVGALALAGLGTVSQWAIVGGALAEALVLAVIATLVASAARVAAGVQQMVSQLNLDVLVLSGVNVGLAIVAGIVQGLLNGRAEIEQATRLLARAAADAASKELEINSPSKVFMRLGESTAEGFAMGVQDGAGAIGSGVGAALTGQVAAASTQAVYNQQRTTTTTDQSVTESNVFYVSNPDPYATAAEIAQQQRSRRYLNGGNRR